MNNVLSAVVNDNSGAEAITRKEVLDYLRNVQKETELRARISGINIWVLWGAFGFVTWQQFENLAADTYKWNSLYLALSIVQLTIIAYFVIFSSPLSESSGPEARLAPTTMAADSSMHKLAILESIWIIAPFAVEILWRGVYWFSILMCAVGGIGLIFEFRTWLFQSGSDDYNGTPLPPKIVRKVVAWVFGILALYAMVQISQVVFITISKSSIGATKFSFLIAVQFWIVYLFIRKTLDANRDRWTYILEKKLILGEVSVEAALRSIEHRSFGTKIASILMERETRIFRIEQRLAIISAELDEKFKEIAEISPEYRIERAGRAGEALTLTKTTMSQLDEELMSLRKLLEKWAASKTFLGDSKMEDMLKRVVEKNLGRSQKLLSLHRYIETLMRKSQISEPEQRR